MISHEVLSAEEIEAWERIEAMRSREDDATTMDRVRLASQIDASSRKAMVDWCFIVCDSFELSRETVCIAMSILDRYLSSGNGKSAEALESKQKFQLATIVAFYTAVKMNESTQIGIAMLMKLCRGYYTESVIYAMELEILSALQWRVYLSATTPMEYVRQFLELLPDCKDTAEIVAEHAKRHMDNATSDLHLSMCRTSYVGIACLAGALNDTQELSHLEKDALWRQLSEKLEFDIASNEVRRVEQRLLTGSSSCEPKRQSRVGLPRYSVNKAHENQSSPVSVMQQVI
jgi:hypothetical protein